MSEGTAEKRTSRSRPHSGKDLVGIATPVFDIILQLKAGLVTPSYELRRRISELLKEMEQNGAAIKIKTEEVQSAKFALASFVDETVLTSDFPLREDWERNPLQLEYFGEHLAGKKFFMRLDNLLAEEGNADVVEIYYVCLLLGFKGMYKIYPDERIKLEIEKVANYLRRANRLLPVALSPNWKVGDQPEPEPEPELPVWVKIGGVALAGLAILLYLVFNFLLVGDMNAAKDQMLR
jgi:type VI secretion system protein ImpK